VFVKILVIRPSLGNAITADKEARPTLQGHFLPGGCGAIYRADAKSRVESLASLDDQNQARRKTQAFRRFFTRQKEEAVAAGLH
jgi:hypothetical protein